MNISITKKCNLNCSYCFAHKENSHISIENFNYFLDFCQKSNIQQLRVIGGEPTQHPKLEKLFGMTSRAKHIKGVHMFTNGIFSPSVRETINQKKDELDLSFLLNVNEPDVVGEDKYKIIENNINYLNKNFRLRLGINIYKKDYDYEHFIKLIKKFDIDKVRVTNAVMKCEKPKNYYLENKEIFFNFINDMHEIGITPGLDCNSIPPCLLSKDELKTATIKCDNYFGQLICRPVIDVLPDLSVIRCFGCENGNNSDDPPNLKDFNSHEMLIQHFEDKEKEFEDFILFEECKNCPTYEKNNIACGCKKYLREK